MLQRVVQFSLRYRGVVIVLGCVAIAYGLYVAARSKLDVFPEFAPPQVIIQTEAPGLSPEEVEALVPRGTAHDVPPQAAPGDFRRLPAPIYAA